VREQIMHALESEGRTQAAQLLRTNPEQANALYATVAGSVVAQIRNLAPITDDSIYIAISAALRGRVTREQPTEGEATRERKARLAASSVAAEIVVPSLSADVSASLSVERLLGLREQLSRSRRRFRETVENSARAIAALPTAKAVEDHMQEFAKAIAGDLAAQRDALKAAKGEQRWSTLGVGTTAAATLLVSQVAAAPIAIPVAGIGVVSIGISQWLMHERPERHKEEPAPHYIQELRSAVGQEDSPRIGGGFRRLFHRK
jgi:hypothetical protein